MARVEKSVFLSYRRKDQYPALSVYQYLTQRNYDVFLDYTSLPSGDFEQIIIANIKARAHFIVVLTPTALERCNEPGDWLRKEIETAIEERRNIIPLFFDGFSFGNPSVAQYLTGTLAALQKYNGQEIPTGFFGEAMDRVRKRYLNVELNAVLLPVPKEVQRVVVKEQTAANNAVAQSPDLQEKVYWEQETEDPTAGTEDFAQLALKESFVFENGRPAEFLYLKRLIHPEAILRGLGMAIPAAQAGILVAGNTKPFPDRVRNRLMDLLGRGVAQAALETGAIVLDEGLHDGVSEIMGQGVADRGHLTKLIGFPLTQCGITPLSASERDTRYDSNRILDGNHTHFVIQEQAKNTGQARTLCRLAQLSASNKDWILCILAGGDLEGTALDLVLEVVRRGWPLLVIEGSGGLADKIARLKLQMAKDGSRRGFLWDWLRGLNPVAHLQETNPRLYEILSDGRITIVDGSASAVDLRKMIKARFEAPKEATLSTAWRQFAEYDLNSLRHRQQWHYLKRVPLVLAVLSVLLVLIYSAPGNIPSVTGGSVNDIWTYAYVDFMSWLANMHANSGLDLFLRMTIIMLPLTSLIIYAMEPRLKLGSKFILLRGAAEAVKRGIYSYRALGHLDEEVSEFLLPSSRQGLAAHLERINKTLQESDVRESALFPYTGPIPPLMFGAAGEDDGFSPLDPETYVKIRIGDQFAFYTGRTNQYERQYRRLQYWIVVFGGMGLLLTVMGAQYWLPMTACILLAVTALLEYQQLDQLITKYNLTRSALENARSAWQALPESERKKEKNIHRLVRDVEAILQSENQGWVQFVSQVQEAGTEETLPSE